MMLQNCKQCPFTFPHFCHLPLVLQGTTGDQLQPARDTSPIWPAAPGQSLSLFFPVLGHVTAVRQHLLVMATVQHEAPALPLTSTSAE